MIIASSQRDLWIERKPFGSRFVVVVRHHGRTIQKFFRNAERAADEVIKCAEMADEALSSLFENRKEVKKK